MSVWDRRKEILYGNGLVGEVNRSNPTPECEVNGTEWHSCGLLELFPHLRLSNLILRTYQCNS